MRSEAFDLKKLDYEANRKQLRRKLLKRSILPAIIVCILALWFLMPSVLTPIAIGKYTNTEYNSARTWFGPLALTSPERFVADFDSGTMDTKAGKFERAEKELNRALSFAPEEKVCMVAQNLAVSHLLHAASLVNSPSQANIYDIKAEEVIEDHSDCFKGGASGGGGGGGSSSNANNNPLSESQQQQLEQKEQKGRDRQEQFARDEEFDPSKSQVKPW